MTLPDIYHVTPITPNEALEAICKGRNLLVSMYRPDQLDLALSLAEKIMGDHGMFSAWIATMKAGREWSEQEVPRAAYCAWLEPWIWNANASAVMPDIPGAPSQLNDAELLDWPFPIEKGLPVYHMNGPISRFGKLLEKYPQVCMGWIGDPKKQPVGCEAYWRRVEEIEQELGEEIWPRTHMLRGVAVARGRPFARADSSSLGQNGHRYDSPIDAALGDPWRGRRSYADMLEGKNEQQPFQRRRVRRSLSGDTKGRAANPRQRSLFGVGL